MKKTVLFALVLTGLIWGGSFAVDAPVMHANLLSSGPLMYSPAIQVVGGMVYGAAAIQQAPADPAPKLEINVDRNANADRRWVVSPVWMAIGGLAILLVIALVVMSARGDRGTTVVRG